MKCEYCENNVTENVNKCPFCGAPISFSENIYRERQSVSNEKKCKEISPLQLGVKSEAEEEEVFQKSEPRENSPYKRIVFLLLGILFGFFGVQFLYIQRYISFAIIFICAVLSIAYADSEAAPLMVIVLMLSFISSFFIMTDGKKRKMTWF